jgi:hypothetical protein
MMYFTIHECFNWNHWPAHHHFFRPVCGRFLTKVRAIVEGIGAQLQTGKRVHQNTRNYKRRPSR